MVRWAAALILATACSDGPVSAGDGTSETLGPQPATSGVESTTTVTGPTSGAATEGGEPEPIFDVFLADLPPEDPTNCLSDGDVQLTGTVFAPNGTLPISGALVYTTLTPPDPLPAALHCSECAPRPCEPDWVLTEPDGSFSVASVSGDDRYFVVRKGDFMRVTPLTFEPGAIELDADITTLPARRDPASGASEPKVAVMVFIAFDPLSLTSRRSPTSAPRRGARRSTFCSSSTIR